MSAVGDWLKVLIVVVLLGNLVDYLLPKGDMKRYGGLVVGLVILAVMIHPLWGWMRQLHHVAQASDAAGWTNTPAGYSTVVTTEELHQAEAIVLSMPHIASCQLTMEADGRVGAVVQTASDSVTAQRVRHYVKAALEVTMGKAPPIHLVVDRSHEVQG
ncbi:stage III sporulation protein AF [Sulfobacillus harzensis]|uniref:Sporulation protein n=1 Tax=Sulfobacillus harzensis TaxID=2729629 RepID=A0A7Y0L197_9FIRM|nr:stage III sporulation protein AF [Sulfobacillus harzensis]NMP21157.1 sporulation protein [Sulfobacillus harzensis]